MTIAYVTQYFPYMTETFVYREVIALRNRGLRVVTYANRQPDLNKLADESKVLMDSTHYVFPLKLIPMITAHLYFIFTRPRHYWHTFSSVMFQRGESWGNRKRTIGHFAAGIYLARQAQRDGVQHLHAHFSVNAATIALVIARLLDLTFSFTVHNNFFTDRLILKDKLRSAQFLISISEYSRDWLLRYAPEIPDLKEKFHIVHCGISLEQFRPKSFSLNGKSPHRPLIFSLAYHAERKGMPYLVEACRILRDRGVDFRCIIGGNGPQTPLLEQMIRDYQLAEWVTLPGVIFQEQLGDYLHKTDIFVLPCVVAANGDIDGVPVVLMEAMAMEIPTVSTTVSGIPELIDSGKEGLLVPEKDPSALADALQKLLQDQTTAKLMARTARQKVENQFNIERSGDQLAEIFKQFLTGR